MLLADLKVCFAKEKLVYTIHVGMEFAFLQYMEILLIVYVLPIQQALTVAKVSKLLYLIAKFLSKILMRSVNVSSND